MRKKVPFFGNSTRKFGSEHIELNFVSDLKPDLISFPPYLDAIRTFLQVLVYGTNCKVVCIELTVEDGFLPSPERVILRNFTFFARSFGLRGWDANKCQDLSSSLPFQRSPPVNEYAVFFFSSWLATFMNYDISRCNTKD